jgi:hypothetical protein
LTCQKIGQFWLRDKRQIAKSQKWSTIVSVALTQGSDESWLISVHTGKGITREKHFSDSLIFM